jgi:hypothetical protein
VIDGICTNTIASSAAADEVGPVVPDVNHVPSRSSKYAVLASAYDEFIAAATTDEVSAGSIQKARAP